MTKFAIAFLSSLGAVALAPHARAADNYAVVYEGAPGDIADKLKRLTNLSLERRAYPTAAAIRRMGIEDLAIVKRALTAAGYYAADVEFRLEGESEEKLRAVFDIKAGPLFTISSHRIVYEDDQNFARPESFDEANVGFSGDADGAALAKNQQAFLAALWSRGFPGAQIVARRADARLEDGTAEAVYTFKSGARAVFDGVDIEGAEITNESFLEKLKTWEEGEIFDRARLVAYRDRLGATGLFSSIEVAPGQINDDGQAPVQVTVAERKRRTIGAGVSYSTSQGPGGRLFLDYRNLFHEGERARTQIEASGVSQSISFDIIKPLPALPGSTFANLAFTNDTTDAFTARSLEISGGFAKKWFDDRFETRAGLGLETSKVKPKLQTLTTGEERNYFISVPLSATWNTEDDPLFLRKGVRASISATPYFGSDQFTRLEAVARSRVHFGGDDRFTLAGRIRIAATTGLALRTLPVNKRVFSGGGSSVRGYDYQSVGPIEADGAPIGGRSAVETALEARARIFKRLELAAFVDAGAVYAESFPDFDGDYLVGAGAGVRYLSMIGPIRLDFAVPLDKRPTDRDFQIYISLGQPF
ncbi:MAG: BamA/TamA family outer membrane protein [Parvularculaceae bacterium]|nr:BamA/TamA family outer membrane protein [Parvularculaceae bacterium]